MKRKPNERSESYSMRLSTTLKEELNATAKDLGMKTICQYLKSLHITFKNGKVGYTSKYDEMAILEIRRQRQLIEDCYELLSYLTITRGTDHFTNAMQKFEELQNQIDKIYDSQST